MCEAQRPTGEDTPTAVDPRSETRTSRMRRSIEVFPLPGPPEMIKGLDRGGLQVCIDQIFETGLRGRGGAVGRHLNDPEAEKASSAMASVEDSALERID